MFDEKDNSVVKASMIELLFDDSEIFPVVGLAIVQSYTSQLTVDSLLYDQNYETSPRGNKPGSCREKP